MLFARRIGQLKMQPPDQARVLMDHGIIAAYARKRWKMVAARRGAAPSNPKKTFAYVPLVSLLYFSCFSSALIQSSFFNVIYVKLLPFGKIRSLAGAPHASGCCKHRTPKPALISKVSLKITSGGKVFKGHTKKT